MSPNPTQMNASPIHNENSLDYATEKRGNEEKSDAKQTRKSYVGIQKWKQLLIFAYIHALYPYGVYLFFVKVKWATQIFVLLSIYLGTLGITAGAHRLWSHKSFKATAPLRILLAFFNSSAFQGTIYDWVRDHRVHHRFTDTDADPYNSKRGFFFSHIGWLLVKKHPDVIEKGKLVDMSDIENDWVVMLQKKYYFSIIVPICAVAVPYAIPVYLWGEDPWNAWIVCCVTRFCHILHCTWAINSFAHMWGYKPYDKFITPAQNVYVAIAALGEGWHNYHHAFPWDYRSSEFSSWELNWTAAFIDVCAKIGWAYDLKTANAELIQKRVLSNGDGTHDLHKLSETKEYSTMADGVRSVATALFPED